MVTFSFKFLQPRSLACVKGAQRGTTLTQGVLQG
jgi:hypothetical protein